MVDAVDTLTVFSGSRRHVIRLTNVSDGTGETTVAKLDISGLVGPDGAPPTRTVVEWIEYDVQGFTSVRLLWDHTTDDEIAVLGTGQGLSDWTASGGLTDPASTGGTGDILLTTAGGASGSTYNITIGLRLKD